MNALWWHWVAAGLALSLCEIFIPTFTLLWFGAAAILTGLVVALYPPTPFYAQMLVWAAASLTFTLAWFRFIAPRMRSRSFSGMPKENIAGRTGLVIHAPADGTRGTARFTTPVLGADEWEFICEQPTQVGDRVSITDHSGNTLIVQNESARTAPAPQPATAPGATTTPSQETTP